MDRLDKTISDVAYILDNLMLLRQIQSTGDCNVCVNKDCKYRPKPGQMVRYNCPFYKTKSEDTTNLCNRCANKQCVMQSGIYRNDCEFFITKESEDNVPNFESKEYIEQRLNNYNKLLKSGILDCCKDESVNERRK